MAWIIGAIALYILLASLIVVALCIHSSRISEMEAVQERWQSQPAQKADRVKVLVEA
jgi:hypothetical protein